MLADVSCALFRFRSISARLSIAASVLSLLPTCSRSRSRRICSTLVATARRLRNPAASELLFAIPAMMPLIFWV
jgi:hypothetical protein